MLSQPIRSVGDMTNLVAPLDDDPAAGPELSGILLRYAAALVMQEVTRPTSVAEIAEAIERLGVRIPGRKGKTVSDALRWEQRNGRVVRVGRDRYVGGAPMPRSTRSRARKAIADARRTGLGNKGLW